jgi:hypothetical protein
MMRLFGAVGWVAVIGLVLGALVLSPQPGSAQARRGGDDEEELRPDKLDDPERKKLQDLQSGKEVVDDTHAKLLDKAAKHFVYRLTIKKHQFKKPDEPGATSETMSALVQEATKHIPTPDPRKFQPLKEEQQKYVREFSKALGRAVHVVLQKKDRAPIARVNAAIILAYLGNTGVEEVADPLCEVLENKEYDDAVKLYALIGLKNLLKVRWYKNEAGEKSFARFKNEDRETRCAKDLVAFMNRKPDNPNVTAEAFQYVRREAIRALAETHLPAVGKGRSPDARPALDLLKLMRKDGISPEPSIKEQAEAAIGLCQMQASLKEVKYQPDYAAYHIAKTVVDFAAKYDAERGQSSQVDWKYYARALVQALAELKNDTKSKSQYINELIARCTRVLTNIESNTPTDHLAVNDWLDKNPPKSTQLFQGMGDAVVKPPQPAAEK